jgi:putative transcriptional regulator
VTPLEKLKTMRIEKKYTCKDMAAALKISKPYYWQIENDKRGLSYDMAFKIAKIFNVKPDDIFYSEFSGRHKQNKEA